MSKNTKPSKALVKTDVNSSLSISEIKERSNFKHRGNETDETYCYNRNTSPEKYSKVWKKWDKWKEEKKKEVENIAKRYNFKVTIG